MSGDAADVAEPLDGHGGALKLEAPLAAQLLDDVEDAPACRLQPSQRAADGNGLAGDGAGDGVALVHADRVHDPGHDLLVGAHVRRRNILRRPDDDADLRGVAARQVFQLGDRERARVHHDAALGTAEWDADNGRFPGHPHRQRAHLIQRDLRVVAEATLGQAARDVVLHPVTAEDADRPVVHVHREVDCKLALADA